MTCVQCRRLELELERAEKRHSLAVEELANKAQTSLTESVRLNVSLTSARMYVQMAEIEIERHHALAHRNLSVSPPSLAVAAN